MFFLSLSQGDRMRETGAMDLESWNIVWSISFGILAFVILVGNIITIVIFSKRKLCKRPHFLLINLAVADLMVGLVSIPIFMIYHSYQMTRSLLLAFDSVDMFAGLASVFTLTVLSLERMHAIGWPFRHRSLSSRTYVLAVVAPWCLAAAVTSSRLLLHYSFITRHHFVAIILFSLTTPFSISVFCYCFIWKMLKSRLPNPRRNASDDKLAKTSLLVTGAFIVTWLPFEILVVVINLCVRCRQLSAVFVYVIKLLHFSNSLINIVIYPLRIPDFREALVQLLPSLSCFRRNCQCHQLTYGNSVLSMTTITDSFNPLGIDPKEQVTSL